MATSLTQNFSKEEFKKNVISNCKSLYRKNIEEANQQEVFQAVSYAVKDIIIDKWIATHKQYEKDDPKMVYYMSMEFLMGRALGNNMINLCAYDEIKEALDELGLDINVIEDQEPDAALGNGGLGRLAACFMDSLATLEYPAYGCGIRYKYGMFKQEIKDGYQVEVPDNWLKDGNPFEIKRSEYRYEVKFGGYVRSYRDEKTGRDMFVQEDYRSVIAVPYDIRFLDMAIILLTLLESGTQSLLIRLTLTLSIRVITRRLSRRRTLQRILLRYFILMITIMQVRN